VFKDANGYLQTPRNLVTALWRPVLRCLPLILVCDGVHGLEAQGHGYVHPPRRRRQQISFRRL